MSALSPEEWKRVEPLVDALLDMPVADRARYLDEACAGDASLRANVEAVLVAGGGMSFLEAPAAQFASPLLVRDSDEDAELMTGVLVGPYRIVRELGRGGMGAVYLAERADGQFEQRVALKLIKRGMDSDEIYRRFRSRASDPRAPPPSAHRTLVRRRRERRGTAVLRDGVHRRRADHRALRRAIAWRSTSGFACSARSATPSATPIRISSSTATSSRRTSW